MRNTLELYSWGTAIVARRACVLPVRLASETVPEGRQGQEREATGDIPFEAELNGHGDGERWCLLG